MKVTIIGLGGLGGALARGLLAAGAVELTLCGRRQASLDAWVGRARTVLDAGVAVEGADVVVLAVKPKGTVELLRLIAPALAPGALVVSCAAGVGLAQLDVGVAISRAMPNIGAQQRVSTTAICLGPHTDHARDRARLHRVFSTVGDVFEPADEQRLHAVTATAASGPAFLLLAVEALVDAGVEHGLSRVEALQCARGALVAAAARLEQGAEPITVRAQVTSPGGTTAAGLGALERGAARGAFHDAIAAAVARSHSLT